MAWTVYFATAGSKRYETTDIFISLYQTARPPHPKDPVGVIQTSDRISRRGLTCVKMKVFILLEVISLFIIYLMNLLQIFVLLVCVHKGGLFSKTEMSEVLTEILKVDPSFDKDSFLKQCERDIIPNILEVTPISADITQVFLNL